MRHFIMDLYTMGHFILDLWALRLLTAFVRKTFREINYYENAQNFISFIKAAYRDTGWRGLFMGHIKGRFKICK